MATLNQTNSPVPATVLSSPAKSDDKWGPYSSAKDFVANMAIVFVILLVATIAAFCITTALHTFIRRRRRRQQAEELQQKQRKIAAADLESLPPSLVFSALAGSRIAGGDGVPECAICLAEFADGERVRVLPVCQHGFHAECVETWLASSTSCPTCRSSCCRPAAAAAVALPGELPPVEP